MPELTIRLLGGTIAAKFTVSSPTELFEVVGEYAELLAGDDRCGMPACGSGHIYPRARTATKGDGKKVKYYELYCGDCGAQLSYGQHTEPKGSMWVKRADDNGLLDNRGWKQYRAIAAPAGERGGPPAASGRPAPVEDAEPLKAMLAEPEAYQKCIDDLFWAMADAHGETNANEPKTAAAWKRMQVDKPTDQELIRRLFNYRVKG